MAYNWKQTAKSIWAILVGDLGEIATAGIMGNLIVESASTLRGFQKQGDYSQSRTASKTYTENVSNGTISRDTFIHDSIGYGLAQWTFYTLKDDLYNYWSEASTVSSIGNTAMQAKFLLWHLKNKYQGVYNNLLKAEGVRDATNIFLDEYERPRDPEATRDERYNMAVEAYNYCQGVKPDPDPPDPPDPDPKPPTPQKRKPMNFIYYMPPWWRGYLR
jgi:hypothetical protein